MMGYRNNYFLLGWEGKKPSKHLLFSISCMLIFAEESRSWSRTRTVSPRLSELEEKASRHAPILPQPCGNWCLKDSFNHLRHCSSLLRFLETCHDNKDTKFTGREKECQQDVPRNRWNLDNPNPPPPKNTHMHAHTFTPTLRHTHTTGREDMRVVPANHEPSICDDPLPLYHNCLFYLSC